MPFLFHWEQGDSFCEISQSDARNRAPGQAQSHLKECENHLRLDLGLAAIGKKKKKKNHRKFYYVVFWQWNEI